MKHFSGIVAWYSADRIPGILRCSSNISMSLILILNSKVPLSSKLKCWIELQMKNYCGKSVGFSFRAPLCGFGGRWFCLCQVFWGQCYNSTFLLFSPSSVMILLALPSCFLVFFLRWGPNSFVSIKAMQIIVFWTKCSVCVFISLRVATEFDYRTTTCSELYCKQLIVWTLNMNYDRKK